MPCTPIFLDTTRSASSCLITKYTSSPILQYYVQSCPTWNVDHIVDKFTNHFGVSWWDMDPCLSLIFVTSSYSTIQAGHIMVRCPILTYALISLIHSYHVLILNHPCWSYRGQVSHFDICTNITQSLLSRPLTQLSMLDASPIRCPISMYAPTSLNHPCHVLSLNCPY